MVWSICTEFREENRFKRYEKKHRAEYLSCMARFADVLMRFDEVGHPHLIGKGYFQSEGEDVYRISQARVQNSLEVRLYIYVCLIESKLYPITIGDKTTQQDDINRCHDIARKIRARVTGKKEGGSCHGCGQV